MTHKFIFDTQIILKSNIGPDITGQVGLQAWKC